MAKKTTPTQSNDRTPAEAAQAVRYLNLIGIPTYGIFAVMPNGDYLPEFDFEANGITPDTPANLEIRTKVGAPASEEQARPQHGEYQNADKVLDLIARASDPEAAIDQLLSMATPGITSEQLMQKKLAMPGVQDRYNKAIRLAWEAA